MELDTSLMYTLMLLAIGGLGIWVYIMKLNNRLYREIIEDERKIFENDVYTQLTVAETIEEKKFFDEFLLTKFNYYLNTYMLAYFASDKDIETKEIKNLKSQYYADVAKTLNNIQKSRILMIFTKEGTELYVHQTFLRLLNDANIRFKQSNLTGMDALNTSTLNTIYKG